MGTRSWGRRGKCYSALTVGSKGLRQTSKLQNFLGSCSKQSASVPVVDFECNFWSKLQKSSTEGNRCRCNWLLVPFTSCWVNASQVAAQRKRQQPIFMLHSITVQKCLLVGPLRPSLIHMSPPVCISGWQDVDVMYFLQDAAWQLGYAQLQSCERDISVPPPPAATSADFISQLGSITTVKIFEELWEYPLRGDVVSCCVEAPLGVDARLWFQLRVSKSPQRLQAVFKSGGNRCQLS